MVDNNGVDRLIFWENHSYIAQWKNVHYAWTVKFSASWNIKYIDNGSWHYRPDFNDKIWKNKVLQWLKDRFWINLDSSIFQQYF